MRKTLLEATQDIMSVLDLDEVNSISDTVESLQVANELRTSYEYLMSQRDWPHLCTLTSFEGLGDLNNPTKMKMPTNINKVKWVKYNNLDVAYLDPYDFKTMVDKRIGNENANAQGFMTNVGPTYWTTYDDSFVWFDAYDNTEDDTMQESKSVVYAVVVPEWQHVDEFVPNMPPKMFSTWIADAKTACSVHLKQTADTLESRRAQIGRNIMQNESWRNEQGEVRFNRKVNYGRK